MNSRQLQTTNYALRIIWRLRNSVTGIIALLSFVGVLTAQSNYADAFLEIGTSPRTIALGQATVALPFHPAGYLSNPASSGFVRKLHINGLYINQFGLADFTALGFTIPTGKKYQWGIQAVSLFIGNIPEHPDLMGIQNLEARRDSIRALTASGFSYFSDRETAVNFNVSRNFTSLIDLGWQTTEFPIKIPVGLNVRLIHKSLYNLTGVGVGFDLGTMFIIELKNIFFYEALGELVVGTSLTNIADTRLFWNSKKEDAVPMQWLSGIRYTQKFGKLPMNLAFYYQKNNQYEDERRYGIECAIFDVVHLRIGRNEGTYQSGIGITFNRYGKTMSIGYSFSDHELGNAHRLGGWVSF